MESLQGIARSIREVQLLLLLLTALFYFVAREAIGAPMHWFLTLLGFGLAVLATPLVPWLRNQPRARLMVEAACMVLFISVLIAQAGTEAGTLSHLYLLPVVAAALVLGRRATALLLVLILACRLLAGFLVGGPGWVTLPVLIGLLAELAPTLLVAFLTCALSTDLERATRTIRFLAERDDLTGLYNLRSFSRLADAEHAATRNAGLPCALLMIDVEQLAQVNERFGHEAGDRTLRIIAASIERATRSGDLCARYGGDEFVVLLPRCSRAAADNVASRIRHDVFSGSQDFEYAMRRLSVAIGVAATPEDGSDLQGLFRKAVRNLRKEKQGKEARTAIPAPRPRSLSP